MTKILLNLYILLYELMHQVGIIHLSLYLWGDLPMYVTRCQRVSDMSASLPPSVTSNNQAECIERLPMFWVYPHSTVSTLQTWTNMRKILPSSLLLSCTIIWNDKNEGKFYAAEILNNSFLFWSRKEFLFYALIQIYCLFISDIKLIMSFWSYLFPIWSIWCWLSSE